MICSTSRVETSRTAMSSSGWTQVVGRTTPSTSQGASTYRPNQTRNDLVRQSKGLLAPGHRLSDCPKRKFTQANFIEQGVEYTDKVDMESKSKVSEIERDEDPGPPKTEISGDEEGCSLMIHRVMMAPKAAAENKWLRCSIFRTTCTAGGRLCSMIIESRSTKNCLS